eukprot:scaffold52038_cov69-Phaeocystis_antarctica.AAC.1
MTLTFVAFHLNLTQHLHSSARPLPCASWGKRFGRSGCSEPQRDTAIFFTTPVSTPRAAGVDRWWSWRTQDDLLRHSSTAQESAPLHPTARFANSVTAPSRTFSDATLQPSAHSAAGFCSRCHRRQVLQFAAGPC